MRILILLILGLISFNHLFAQNSLNMNVVYQWKDTSLVSSVAHDNVYNEVWGYENKGKEYAIIGSTAGTHIFNITDTNINNFDVHELTNALKRLYQEARGEPLYILLNLEGYHKLPLNDFILELKQFYASVNKASVFIALMLHPSLVTIVQSMVKTLVTREALQNFSQEEKALLWLSIERKKIASKATVMKVS